MDNKQLKKRIEDWAYVSYTLQEAIDKRNWQTVDMLRRLATAEVAKAKSLETRKLNKGKEE